MGDRVLYQVHSAVEQRTGAVVYAHWGGSHAIDVVHRLRKRMSGRMSDTSYWTARLVQEVLADFEEGNLSVGIDPAQELDDARRPVSHGDAGVVRINCDDGSVDCYGGYLDAASFRPPI